MQRDSTNLGRGLRPRTVGNGAEFASFYRTHLDEMVRLATFLLCSQSQAEEIVQEAFLVVHGRWGGLHTPGGFLRTIVVNKCKDTMRRQSLTTRTMGKLRRTVEGQTTDDPAETHAESDYFLGLLQQLKPRRRTVLVLKFYGGHTMREIAELLSLPEGTVRTDVRRGLEQLRNIADEF